MACGFKTKKWQIKAKPTWYAGPRPKSGKLRLNLHGTISKGKLIGLDPKKELKREREGPHTHEGIQLSSSPTPIAQITW